MNTPIYVTRSSMPDFDEYIDEIRDLWDSRYLTNMGPKHQAFQRELEKYNDIKHVDLFTNGHMAIELSLLALGLQGEVITTPFTFASTTHAIVRNGLTPVFCDVNPEDYTMDVDQIRSLITDKTCAILPVHVYGNVCNIEAIEEIAREYGLKVIYDAAHTFGSKYKGRAVASYGDISCLSFHATKVFHSVEGGAACYKDDSLPAKLFQVKNFGIRDAEHVDSVGANAKMNEFCAAMGLCNLRHIDDWIRTRGYVVECYRENLKNIPGLTLNKVQADVTPNHAYFPVLIDPDQFGMDRDQLAMELASEHIFARKYFYPITNEFGCYKNKNYRGQTPVAHRLSRQVLTLPLFEEMTYEQTERIVSAIHRLKK